MSRPFSYNDENFTVIGNLLFCHFNCTAPLKENSHIVALPPEVYNRLMFFENRLLGEYDGGAVTGNVSIGCHVGYDGRHYWIDSSVDFDHQGKLHLWSIYPLRDI